jgi:hypothetical protein
MIRGSLFLLLATFAVATLVSPPASAAAPSTRRIAVLVGANDPPHGRQALRFAHDDANELADVLKRVGSFAPGDVHVLLDPHPSDVLAAIDAAGQIAAASDVLFLFYYSGHSDGQALFPHGETIAVADVRARIENLHARIRVGILDTCRGGSWTQSKGLSLGPPLDMADLLNVETEGTALVSSSSGLEDAHEASAVHGSFFTHYLAAGLRGAADRAGDGNVTLQEAYDYARERTVHESAQLAQTPQHPSFEIGLHGRQDIVLSVLSQGTSALAIAAPSAPVEVIALPNGVTVADAPAGQPLRVALPPGHYLVRTVKDGRVYTHEVEVRADETATLEEAQLEPAGNDATALKGPGPTQAPLGLWTSPRGYSWLLSAGLGVGSLPTNVGQGTSGTQNTASFGAYATLWYRITDRLSWQVPFPAVAYRFGDPGGVEVMPYLGLSADSWSGGFGVDLGFRADVAARIWTARNQRIKLLAGVVMPAYHMEGGPLGIGLGSEADVQASVGYSWTIHDIVTLGADIGVIRDYSLQSNGGASGWSYGAEWLRVGGEVNVRLSPQVGLDTRFGWQTDEHTGLGSYPSFLVGPTVAF